MQEKSLAKRKIKKKKNEKNEKKKQ